MGNQRGVVVGADGWKRGWVAVLLGDGDPEVRSFSDFASLAAGHPGVSTIVVDIPIGLPEGPTRQADVAARRLLGARASSVFSTPPRVAIEQDTLGAALATARQELGVGISAQAYALRGKILEVEAVAISDGRVFEGHPEVSFWALAGGRPMQHPKKSWNGQVERRRLLEEAGIVLPDHLPGSVGQIPADDVLDAAVMAWTARQLAEGKGVPLPDPPERIGGREVAIWFGERP
jgi:predicted RNase H-like nuclease